MDYVCKAIVAERIGNKLHSCAMYGSIDDLQVGMTLDNLGIERKLLYIGKECFVDFFPDYLDLVRVALEADFRNTLYTVHMIDDVDIMRSYNLCAVAPVSLITIIFLGIM